MLLALSLFGALPSVAEPVPTSIAGVASVKDGDTIIIRDREIRLSGFDSPERGKRCGQENIYQRAALELSDFIGRQTVTCEISGEDRWERLIGVCSVGGADLGEFMVSEGWARDWPRYSGGAYAEFEQGARKRRVGVWAKTCPDTLWGDRNYD